jgi:hypothetical protein
MTEYILTMAHHASQKRISLISSHVTATFANMFEPDGPTAWSSGGDKPKGLIAIDYSTLVSLLLVTSISAILLATTAFKAWRGGAIKLDTSDRRNEKTITRKEVLGNTLLQNMDHTLDEDGEAVNEAQFWRAVSPRMMTSSSLTYRYDGTKPSS